MHIESLPVSGTRWRHRRRTIRRLSCDALAVLAWTFIVAAILLGICAVLTVGAP